MILPHREFYVARDHLAEALRMIKLGVWKEKESKEDANVCMSNEL